MKNQLFYPTIYMQTNSVKKLDLAHIDQYISTCDFVPGSLVTSIYTSFNGLFARNYYCVVFFFFTNTGSQVKC